GIGGGFGTSAGLKLWIKAGTMVLKKSAARMVTISSWAAAMASGEGVCARAGPAADKQTTRQTVGIHECLRMKPPVGGRTGIIPHRGCGGGGGQRPLQPPIPPQRRAHHHRA